MQTLSTSSVNSFDFKYYNLKYNVFDVLKKLLLQSFENAEHSELFIINAIFRFYSGLNSAFQVNEIVPFLLKTLGGTNQRVLYRFFVLDGVKVS